ncbi:MAG: type I-E CRISPR-associated protein Cas6/Cse3/CasE [bacterium]
MPDHDRGNGAELYLSRLFLDPRSKQVQRELSELYELHRTLMRAFPMDGPKPDASAACGVLFRVDEDSREGAISVLVQSSVQPDWAPLRALASYLDPAADPEPVTCKAIHRQYAMLVGGATLSFRLRANPTKRRKDNAKRVGLYREQEQLAWLRRKAECGGFEVLQAIAIREPFALGKLTDASAARHDLKHNSVKFEGTLRVTEPSAFVQTLRNGIGSAKAFGFGLLSLGPPH